MNPREPPCLYWAGMGQGRYGLEKRNHHHHRWPPPGWLARPLLTLVRAEPFRSLGSEGPQHSMGIRSFAGQQCGSHDVFTSSRRSGSRQDEFRENEVWEGGSLNLTPPRERGPHRDSLLGFHGYAAS